MRRARNGARCVKAIEAAICFSYRSLLIERRMQIAETICQLRINRDLLMKGNSLAHSAPGTSVIKQRTDSPLRSLMTKPVEPNVVQSQGPCIMNGNMTLLCGYTLLLFRSDYYALSSKTIWLASEILMRYWMPLHC